MAAQRQRIPTKTPHSRLRSLSPVVPAAASSDLQHLYAMRADALTWLASLDQRILALGGVIIQPLVSDGETGT